ncbi:MAG: cobalt ABC transporter permease [bacterium]
MKLQILNFKFKIFSIIFLLFTIHCSLYTAVFAEEKWPGVDESVVEKYAKEHGREAREPLINTDQGDLLLFVFLLAGTVGGFAAGYYWRVLTERRDRNTEIGGSLSQGK